MDGHVSISQLLEFDPKIKGARQKITGQTAAAVNSQQGIFIHPHAKLKAPHTRVN